MSKQDLEALKIFLQEILTKADLYLLPYESEKRRILCTKEAYQCGFYRGVQQTLKWVLEQIEVLE